MLCASRAPAAVLPGAGGTLFEPRITPAAAARRHAKWKKAVERSFALADLTEDLDEDSEQRPEVTAAAAAAGGAGGGGKGLVPEPEGPKG